jgi:hypothetical protein
MIPLPAVTLMPGTTYEPLPFQGFSDLHFTVERLYYRFKRLKSLNRRFPSMIIDKVLAVYNISPLLLVVESDEGKLFELSLKDLKAAGHIFSDVAWKSLVEDYRIFNSQHAPR